MKMAITFCSLKAVFGHLSAILYPEKINVPFMMMLVSFSEKEEGCSLTPKIL